MNGIAEGKKVQTKGFSLVYANPETHRSGHHSPDTLIETVALREAGVDLNLLTVSGLTTGQPPVRHSALLSPFMARFMDRSGAANAFVFFVFAALAFRMRKRYKADVLLFRDFEPHTWMLHFLGIFNRDTTFVISVLTDPTKFFSRPLVTSFFVLLCKASMRLNSFAYVASASKAMEVWSSVGNGILQGRTLLIPLSGEIMTPRVTKSEARKRLGLPPEGTVFLLFGVTKDTTTVLQAFSKINNAILLIAGRGDGSDGIPSGSLPPHLIFKEGFFYGEERDLFYVASDASILAYDRRYYHGSGGLRTACGYGLPVISSDVGEVGPMVRDHGVGLIYRTEDSDSLRKTILEFMSLDERQNHSLRQNCIRFAREFSSEKWAKKHKELFRILLLRKTSGGGHDCSGSDANSMP